MKIIVKAKPNAKKIGVRQLAEKHFAVAVSEPPREGRANQAIQRALAEYFDTARSNIILISGATSKQKVFEIPDWLKPKTKGGVLF